MNNAFRRIVAASLGLIMLLAVGQVALAQTYNQSPMLTSLVKAGKLPPVTARLPEKPLVVDVVKEIGQYGGTWRVALQDPVERVGVLWPLLHEPLVRWDRSGSGIIPNVAESWDISRDYRTYTFHVRKGIKWSDGVPLTADDILFWYEEVMGTKELTPAVPAWLRTSGQPAKVEKLDDYTVRFTFSQPYVLFLQNIAMKGGQPAQYMIRPKHYLKQFLPKYAPLAQVNARAKAAGFTDWYSYFWNQADPLMNPDCPTINAWKLDGLFNNGTVFALSRNSYYWKVDSKGNQLPYIDKVSAQIVGDAQVVNMKIAAGELETDFTHTAVADYAFLKKNQDKGGYRVLLWSSATGSNLALMPNLNRTDPVLKALFNDLRFREALSYAINRDEINELCFFGLAQPRQATVIPQCPYYQDDLPKLYANYDPQEANKLLDSMGLKRQGGTRLRPDGKPLQITIEYTPRTIDGPWDDMIALVAKYWSAIGVKTAVKSVDKSLYAVRKGSNEVDVLAWSWSGGVYALIDPNFVFPSSTQGTSTGAQLYAQWYETGGKLGEKPSGDILKAGQLYDKYKTTTDESERLRLGKELVKLSAENVWSIGTVGLSPKIVVVNNDFHNVPEKALLDWSVLNYAYVHPEQFFIEK